MCGIAGIIALKDNRSLLEAPLASMQTALRHRGPDDQGFYRSPERLSKEQAICGFAHSRLSILDLSMAGHQPMTTADGRFTIVFNGEIYNFHALRERLIAAGTRFSSHSDTEVILHLYAQSGARCVQDLRGMFAFAIWDQLEGSCFLARDPLGIKPLYYCTLDSRLIFASEVRALLASGLVPLQLDFTGTVGFFQSGSLPEPFTLIQSVRSLPAGTTLKWRNAQTVTSSFWHLEFSADFGERADLVPRVRKALLDSVRHHFVSDVPVGVFLSGGIDSTALVALARASGQQGLRTFSISFDDAAFDEGHMAARTASVFGTLHSDHRLTGSTSRELFQEFLKRIDQPSIDGFNSFTVSKFASQEGMKVVLSGVGGDELFGGYPSFQNVPKMLRIARRLGIFRPLVAGFLEGSTQPRHRRFAAFLAGDPNLDSAYQAYRGIFTAAEADSIARQYCDGSVPAQAGKASSRIVQPTEGDEVSEKELTLYMRNQLLRDSDSMSMACGLELRLPFVDRTLVDVLTRIPASIRLAAGKRLLLEAVPEVPEWVSSSPKRGFVFPFERWLSDDWKGLLGSTTHGRKVRLQSWSQRWSVFVFESWCNTHGIPFASTEQSL